MIPSCEGQPLTGSASSTKGRNGPRSRAGCWTCRSKKVKCDEQQPHCSRCVRLNLRCDYSERPKLSERRKLRRERENSEILDQNDLVVATYDPGASLIRSNLKPPSTGQCSLELGSRAHEAIRFFQTSFSESLHTKNPKYSLFSIMLKIAQDSPVVMHMAIAIALKDIHLRSLNPPSNSELTVPIHHYSAALRLMTEQLNNPSQTIDLDALYTALFLMLTYEEKFGDPQGQATRQHLMGAASILRASRKKMLSLPKAGPTESKGKELALVKHQPDISRDHYSLYSARILTWMAFYDASAAAWGIGGSFNAALHECFQLEDPDGKYDSFYSLSTLKAYRRLEKYSNALYRSIWGESYPQSELLDDVENRNVFALLSHCGQLRFMIAELTSLWEIDREAAVRQASNVAATIEKGQDSFGELMEVASELSIDTDDSQRLVRNIRNIVPFHYAAVLEFLRLIRFHEPLENRQRHALREIMNLAFQAFKHSGDLAMTRVAWPLFIAALETDDLVHRDWILQRFQSLRQYGQNFERAHRFLIKALADQDLIGGRIDIRQRMKSGDAEYFVLTR